MTSDRFSVARSVIPNNKRAPMNPDSSPLSSSLKREQQDSLVHFTEPANRPESLSETDPTWVLLSRPGMSAQRKGPFRDRRLTEQMVRDLYELYPDATCLVINAPLTIYPTDGREWVSMFGDQRRKRIPPAVVKDADEPRCGYCAHVMDFDRQCRNSTDAGRCAIYQEFSATRKVDDRLSGENEVLGQVNKEGISSGVHTPGNSNRGKGDYLAAERRKFEASMVEEGEELDFRLYTLPGCENLYSNSTTQLVYFAWRKGRASIVDEGAAS